MEEKGRFVNGRPLEHKSEGVVLKIVSRGITVNPPGLSVLEDSLNLACLGVHIYPSECRI